MLALQLERSRRELDVCRRQLAQMNDLFDAHKRSEALLQGEKKLTEMIARGDSLEAMLEGSCRLVEEGLPGSLAIILLLDGKRLRRGAAPSFPKYLAEVDGFEINPTVGTCSAAAARKEQVITEDITTDPHWAGYLELAARHGLRAGWATPILSSARCLGRSACTGLNRAARLRSIFKSSTKSLDWLRLPLSANRLPKLLMLRSRSHAVR